ncbi:MAG: hypothetical protein HZB65_04995 [Candidatus Aenigmarchaeota archaeon]|nr:hypothetical protein [Candidatus Aenigmarchaeota archaeon]
MIYATHRTVDEVVQSPFYFSILNDSTGHFLITGNYNMTTKQEAYDYLDRLLSTTEMKELGKKEIIEYSRHIDAHHEFRHRLTRPMNLGKLTPKSMQRIFHEMFGQWCEKSHF